MSITAIKLALRSNFATALFCLNWARGWRLLHAAHSQPLEGDLVNSQRPCKEHPLADFVHARGLGQGSKGCMWGLNQLGLRSFVGLSRRDLYFEATISSSSPLPRFSQTWEENWVSEEVVDHHVLPPAIHPKPFTQKLRPHCSLLGPTQGLLQPDSPAPSPAVGPLYARGSTK